MLRHADRRDANEADLIRIARQCGAFVLQMKPGQGFDALILFRGKVFIVEFKDGKKPPSARQLTDDEVTMQQMCHSRGVTYNIILCEADLLAMLGVKVG